MVQRGEVPDMFTYNTLMDGFCLVGRFEEANVLFDSMASKGCEPNAVSYNVLKNGYCKN